MASETIIVQIDEEQLKAQKDNQYSLYLAKKVNGAFTVIWQSKGPVATVNNPSYQQNNVFNVATPAYKINYTNIPIVQGSVTFTSSGKAVPIDLGQTVKLDKNGIFSDAANTGTKGQMTVDNALAGNPHAILSDANGNPIFINTASGMNIGDSTLTPIDEYQVWFDNYQKTGTMIAHNLSKMGIVTFDGGADTMTISYNKDGGWQKGPLASGGFSLAAAAVSGNIAVQVMVYFSTVLTAGAVTYLLNKFIGKFADGLQPTRVVASVGSAKLEVTFADPKGASAALADPSFYDAAVNRALNASKADGASDLAGESWTFDNQQLIASP